MTRQRCSSTSFDVGALVRDRLTGWIGRVEVVDGLSVIVCDGDTGARRMLLSTRLDLVPGDAVPVPSVPPRLERCEDCGDRVPVRWVCPAKGEDSATYACAKCCRDFHGVEPWPVVSP